MRVLVTGSTGQLGTAFQMVAADDVVLEARSEKDVDVTRTEDFVRAVEEVNPDVVINCAAYTDVDGCEDRPLQAFAVNAVAPGFMAAECHKRGVYFIHISTDYVFDGGKNSPYVESDHPFPVSIYGVSKLAGEHLVLSNSPSALVVRTSGLYGPSFEGKGAYNFVLFVLTAAREKGEVTLVQDHVLSPTFTFDLAKGILGILAEKPSGIIHMANEGAVSWVKVGREILAVAGIRAQIREVTWAHLKRKAKRPRYSALASEVKPGLLPSWRDALRRYMSML